MDKSGQEAIEMNIRCGEAAIERLSKLREESLAAVEAIPEENIEEKAAAYAYACGIIYGLLFVEQQVRDFRAFLTYGDILDQLGDEFAEGNGDLSDFDFGDDSKGFSA